MNHHKIAVRYSKAIFLLAKEKGLLDEVKEDMLLINKVCNEVNDVKRMLSAPTIQTSKKQQIFHLIFKDNVNNLTLSFIDMLTTNKREAFISDITRNYLDLYRRDKNIKAATLTTSEEVGEKTRNEFTKIIKQIYNSEVELSTQVKNEIIGGFILRVDDKQIDTSVASQLKEIKRELINTTYDYKILG